MRHYLVDFLLWVCEEGGEVAESFTVEHHLGLFICSSYYVPNSPQGSSLDVEQNTRNVFIPDTVMLIQCLSTPEVLFI